MVGAPVTSSATDVLDIDFLTLVALEIFFKPPLVFI